MVANNGYCRVNGEDPTDCYISSIELSDCQAACTAHKPCVGYEYLESSTACFLIPSSISCPTGYTLTKGSITAATSNDLEAQVLNNSAVCYGKNIGNINMARF